MSNSKWNQEDINNWKKWKDKRDQDAGNYLVSKYIPLVDYVVQRFAINIPPSISKDELQSFGFNGLLDAFDKFDLERGLQFETYANWRIKGAIIDGLRQNDWIPRSAREKARKIEEAYTVLEQQKLRSVSDQEVSEYLGITEEEVNQTLLDVMVSTLTSIDEPVFDADDQQVGRYHMIQNAHAELPETKLQEDFVKETLTEVIERLPEKEKIIVSLFYFDEMTLTEIAEILGLSTSRISQLHSKAVLRLKAAYHENGREELNNVR